MKSILNKCAKVLLLSLVLSWQAGGAIPPKGRWLVGAGSQIGGMAGAGFTLLDMRLSQDQKKKIERIVMDVGDMNGDPLKGLPGYYHVELRKNPHRLVIDMSQTPRSRVDQAKLANIFKKSIWIEKTAMTLDPVDNTLNISLSLKKNAKVRVLQVAGQKQTSKIVLDIITE